MVLVHRITNYIRNYEVRRGMKAQVKRDDLIFPELSYQIVGCAYEVFDELGPGHLEKIYQKAFAVAFKNKELKFTEQVYYNLKFKDEIVGKAFLDFCVDDKIIVELKKDDSFSKTHIEQVLNYLKLSNLKLAILFNFTKEGVKFRRIVSINQPVSSS